MSLAKKLPSLVRKLRAARTDTSFIEVKTAAKGVPKTLAETLSAFANGVGGIIILGMDEHAGFSVVKGFDTKRAMDGLATAASDQLTPPLRIQIETVNFEGEMLVAAEVPPLLRTERPCYLTSRGMFNGSFIRTGDGDRRMRPYEVERLLENSMQPRYDEEVVSRATMDAFDSDVVVLFMKHLQHHKPRLCEADRQQVFRRLHIIGQAGDGNWHPTLCGLLALGTYPQEFFPRLNIVFSTYPGTSKADVQTGDATLVDTLTLEGPLAVMVNDTLDALNARMGTPTPYGQDRNRQTALCYPKFPLPAIREVLVNALVHRDYSPESRGTPIQVDLYANRLEIHSPGGLFGTVALEEITTQGVTSARNARLSVIVEDLTLNDGRVMCANVGSGLITANAHLKKAGLPGVTLEETPAGFRTIFTLLPPATPRTERTDG